MQDNYNEIIDEKNVFSLSVSVFLCLSLSLSLARSLARPLNGSLCPRPNGASKWAREKETMTRPCMC